MIESSPITCDLAVVGAGMAGMAATLYAVERGMSVVQVGSSKEIGFASGLFDLLGVYPAREKRRRKNPWAGIDALTKDVPNHPYARAGQADIKSAFEDLFAFLAGVGLGYRRRLDQNVNVVTPIGTLKTTYGVPETVWPGVEALENRLPCALVGITGLKGYSVKLMADRLQPRWPGVERVEIVFPGTRHGYEVYPEHLANALVVSKNRQRLIEVLKPHAQDVEAVAMPAVLGLYNSRGVVSEMAECLGVPVFEIPTMPPGISGMRLKAAFESGLRERGATYEPQKRVIGIAPTQNGGFELQIGKERVDASIRSKGVILATGRFIGGGLSADRKQIRETLLDLPVYQPDKREAWHQEDLFDARGHAINQAGLETDAQLRPLGRDKTAAFEALFAAGSILAHQDWKRTKCGVGLAIGTAYRAVRSFASFLNASGTWKK